MHAYDGLQGNHRLFRPFLKVLAKYGVPTDLIHKVTQSYTLCLAEGVGGEGGAVDVGSKRLRNNFFLERHISALTEILAGQSNKWENIGISLNLPNDALKYIFSLIHIRSFKMNLKEVLVQWIVGQHQHAKAPTVENLKAALRSETVGLGGMANQLDDELIKHGICLDDEDTSSLAIKPSLTATGENLKVAQRSSVANQLDDDVICLDDEEPSPLSKRLCLHTDVCSKVGHIERFSDDDDEDPSPLSKRLCWHTGVCSKVGHIERFSDDDDDEEPSPLSKRRLCWHTGVCSKVGHIERFSDDDDDEDPSPLSKRLCWHTGVCSKVGHIERFSDDDDEDPSPLSKRPCLHTGVCSKVEHIERFNDEEPSPLPCLDAPLLYIVSQSLDTSILEDKSTLLEVQVEASHGTTISYQWLKDDLPLKEGEDFIGTNKPILCINNSFISKSEGAYVSKITSKNDHTPASLVYSEHIYVSVTVPPLKKVLMERYCTQPEIPEDSWPPRGGNTYINLALIKQGSIEKAGKYARNTIQGDMDDIFANKDSIEYEDVFTDLKSGTLLLIEGRPGSGKTTLVHKISQDWGRGKFQLKLLFLVHLRGFFNDSNIGLRDIVQQYYTQEGKHMVEEILENSVNSNGEGLCFILDGLDEYNPDSEGQTFIFKLIKKELLPNSVVIVASRPAATANLRRIATRQIEVIGFLKKQIYDYVEKYQFSDVDKIIDLHKYLDHHPNVHHMCYLPIHAAMVCYLFDVMGSKLPRTETKMYIEFTNHTLLRTLTRYKDKITYLESPDKLLGQDKDIFHKICELAFEKTAASRQVLKKSEIPHFSNISSGNESMGLITVDCMASVCGFENLYTFLHLTFQEFLAAYHISKLEEEKQLEVITQYSQKKHMIVVWKFYCGLVNFNEQKQKLRKIMSLKDDLFNVHCAFESQQTVTCDSVVMTGESGTLSFNNHFLTPSDSTAIGYVVKNAKCFVEKVVLNRCKLSKEGTNALFDEAGDKISSLKALSFHGKDCRKEQFKLLNTCLHSMESLEVFDISHTNLGTKKINLLTENLTLPSLQTLKLSSSMLYDDLQSLTFGSPIFRQVLLVDGDICHHQEHIVSSFGFSPFLSGCGSQAHIWIQDQHIKLSELEVLSNSIGQFSCCTTLCLTNCNIGDDIGALKNLALLEFFDVSVNGISDSGATALADNIQHCKKLQNLNMSFNHIGDSGAMVLAESLYLLINLKKLDLSYNLIGDKGAIAVTRAIKNFQDFELLLWNHRITKEGVGTVTDLKPDIELKIHVLNLMGMSVAMLDNLAAYIDGDSEQLGKIQVISFKGLRKQETILQVLAILKKLEEVHFEGCNFLAFVDGIKHCSELKTLNLKGSNLGATGTQKLANLVKHYPNLLTLNLCGNSIGPCGAKVLADGLMHCTNLQVLNLSKNRICTALADNLIAPADGINALTDGLKHCTKLQTLNLDDNDIDNDGALALANTLNGHTNLEVLNLSFNSIGTGGAKAIAKNCTTLKTLILDSNHIGPFNVHALVKYCHNLQILQLDLNRIGAIGAKALAGLKHCTNLQTLHLSSNGIGAYGAKALADSLKHCTNLQTLHLNRNKIGVGGVKALADGIKHCTNLHTLQLSSNGIGAYGAKTLADSLKHCTYLQTLHLGQNEIYTDGAKAIAEGLKHCTNLQTLDLHHNEIGNDGVKALADYLKHCTNLQALHLDHNIIGSDGAKALADYLKLCTNLQTLQLDVNIIGADGAKAFADCLEYCTNLQTLHLNCNQIGFYGAKALADCLKHCTNLQTLHLDGNRIGADGANALADGLKHCTNLQALHLYGNEICTDGAKALAYYLRYWTNLQTLNFDGNIIGTNGAKALADGLKHCNNLQALHLDCNEIGTDGTKALADGLKQCANMQTLHLDHNKISADGAEALAKHCTNLQTLHLDHNKISADGAEALAKHCTNLQTLHLDHNKISADGAEALAKHCTNLRAIYLDCNRIGADGAKAFADCLKHCTNLQTLYFDGNRIGTDGATGLANGLKYCTNLQTLHLNSNEIGLHGAKFLANSLKHCTYLQALQLDGNNIGADGAKALADGLKHCTKLQTLHLDYNNIGADGAKALAYYLRHCTNLQTLHLDYNKIGTVSAKALADGIKHCTNLLTLHLDWNEIRANGAKALADSLKHCNNMQVLHLNGNEIGIDGAKALTEGLKHCTNLQTLHLDYNKIGTDGAKALVDYLKHCTNLQTLHLDSNTIGADGAKALADGLKHCTNLQTLHLDYNEIGTDGTKVLADGLKHCTNLQTLHLDYNKIGADGTKALADGLKHCTNLQSLHLDRN